MLSKNLLALFISPCASYLLVLPFVAITVQIFLVTFWSFNVSSCAFRVFLYLEHFFFLSGLCICKNIVIILLIFKVFRKLSFRIQFLYLQNGCVHEIAPDRNKMPTFSPA